MSASVEPAEAVAPPEARAHEQVAGGTFFSGFDGLRAIAALMVLVTHVWLASSSRNPRLSPFLNELDIGVPVFFVISGFLLYRPFVAARFAGTTTQSVGAFWKRRALRIFPAYWVCLLIVSAFMYWGPKPIDSAKAFVTHFFLLQIYSHDRVINGPVQQSWTLAVEVAFYAFLPFYALAIRHVRARRRSSLAVELGGVAALYGLSVAYRVALLVGNVTPSQFSHYRLFLPGFLDQLALGMGIAVLSAWLAQRPGGVTAPRWLAGASWAAAVACFWLAAKGLGLPVIPTAPRTDGQFLLEQLVRGLFALFLVLPAVFAAARPGRIHRFLRARVMVFLGLVSYGIYLWHEAWVDTYLHWRGFGLFQAPMLRLGLFTIVTTVVTAAVSYWAIERPALRLKRRRLVPRPVEEAARRVVARWSTFEWGLLAIFVLGVSIRFVYIWYTRRPHFAEFGVIGDAGFYHGGSNLLAAGKGFINPFQYYGRGLHIQDASHPPLYILWLTIPSLVGLTSTTAHMLWTLPVGAATIVCVGYAGREIVGKRVGLIAAFLAAVYPNVWSHDGILTSETMSIFTTTLTVWMAYRYRRAPSMRRAVALGLAVGLAVAARSEMALLIPLVVIPVILATHATSWRERWKRLVAAGLVVVAIVGPWVAYNLTRFEKPVYLSTGYGITLLSANCDETYYGSNIGYWSMKCTLPIEAKDKLYRTDQSVAEAKYRKVALTYIDHHKERLAVVTLVRWARYVGLWDLTHHFDQVGKDKLPEGREPFVAWSSVLLWFVLLPSAVAGVFVLRRRRMPVYIVVAPIVITFVTITITFHQNRYRASAETAFCLLAAVTFDALWRSNERRRATRAVLTTPEGSEAQAQEAARVLSDSAR